MSAWIIVMGLDNCFGLCDVDCFSNFSLSFLLFGGEMFADEEMFSEP